MIYTFIYLFIYLSIRQSVFLSVYLSICLSVYLSPSLHFGHRPSATVCQRSCSGPSFLIGSISGHSFWCWLPVTMPGVIWLPFISLTQGILAKGLSWDTWCWFAKSVPYPFSSLPSDFIFCWYLVVLPLEVCELLMIFGQWISRIILLRQLLMIVLTFLTVW